MVLGSGKMVSTSFHIEAEQGLPLFSHIRANLILKKILLPKLSIQFN